MTMLQIPALDDSTVKSHREPGFYPLQVKVDCVDHEMRLGRVADIAR
ncbi:hypothetical protein [Neorhizobium sp. NCHU2750]